MRDFTVKKVEINSGPSLIKTYFTIMEGDCELGFLTSCFMQDLGGSCTSTFLYRKWGHSMEIAKCLYDAVKGIIESDSVETIDLVCNLLLNIGLTL